MSQGGQSWNVLLLKKSVELRVGIKIPPQKRHVALSAIIEDGSTRLCKAKHRLTFTLITHGMSFPN